MVVVPERGRILLERIGADARLAADEPVFWMAIVFGGGAAAVEVDAGADIGDVATAAVK